MNSNKGMNADKEETVLSKEKKTYKHRGKDKHDYKYGTFSGKNNRYRVRDKSGRGNGISLDNTKAFYKQTEKIDLKGKTINTLKIFSIPYFLI